MGSTELRLELVGDLSAGSVEDWVAPVFGSRVGVLEDYGVVVVGIARRLIAWFVADVEAGITAHKNSLKGDRRRIAGSAAGLTSGQLELDAEVGCLGPAGSRIYVGTLDKSLCVVEANAPLVLSAGPRVGLGALPLRLEIAASRVAIELDDNTVRLLDADTLAPVLNLATASVCSLASNSALAVGGNEGVVEIYDALSGSGPSRRLSPTGIEFEDDDAAAPRRVRSLNWLTADALLCAYDKGVVAKADDVQCAVLRISDGECISQPADLDDCVVSFAPTENAHKHRLECVLIPAWDCAVVVANVSPEVKVLRSEPTWDWHLHEPDDETILRARVADGQEGDGPALVSGIALASPRPRQDALALNRATNLLFLFSTAGTLSCYRFTHDAFDAEPLKEPRTLPQSSDKGNKSPTAGFATAVTSKPTVAPSANKPKSASGFAGIPPMAKIAPKSFGASSPAPGFAGIPPMSLSAPSPFGIVPVSATVDTSAGFSQKTSGAQRPVGTLPAAAAGTSANRSTASNTPKPSHAPTAALATGFAGIPPMASNAPKLFNKISHAPAAGFAGIPPMSATAPKAFGSSSSTPAAGFAGVPPMSLIAPRPVGAPSTAQASGFATISSESTTAKSTAATPLTPNSGSSGYPPVSSTAPKPFDAKIPAPTAGLAASLQTSSMAQKQLGASSPAQAGGFAGIPPMSSTAPKPLGTRATAPAAGFAGIPPMSLSAPKPFRAPSRAPGGTTTSTPPRPSTVLNAHAASSPASAGGFTGVPPPSSSAPKPGSGLATAPAAGFAGIPPMSSIAPTTYFLPSRAPSSGSDTPSKSTMAPKLFGTPSAAVAATFDGNSYVSSGASPRLGTNQIPGGTGDPYGISSASTANKPVGALDSVGAAVELPSTASKPVDARATAGAAGFLSRTPVTKSATTFGSASAPTPSAGFTTAPIPPMAKIAPKPFGTPKSASLAQTKPMGIPAQQQQRQNVGQKATDKHGRGDTVTSRNDLEHEKSAIVAEFDQALESTRSMLQEARVEANRTAVSMDAKGEKLRTKLRSLTVTFDSGEAGWRDLTRNAAALLGNCEDASRRVLDAEWSLSIARGLSEDPGTCASIDNGSVESRRIKKAAAQWRMVLETRELDAPSKARLEKLMSMSEAVDRCLNELSLVLRHRQVLDDTLCKPSPASLIVTTEYRRASQSIERSERKKKADIATFFNRLRSTYEAARVLDERTVPHLKRRLNRLSQSFGELRDTDALPRPSSSLRLATVKDDEAREAFKYEEQLSRLVVSATKLAVSPRDERASKLVPAHSRGIWLNRAKEPHFEVPPIALCDEDLRGAPSVLFSKSADVQMRSGAEGNAATFERSGNSSRLQTALTAAATPQETPKNRILKGSGDRGEHVSTATAPGSKVAQSFNLSGASHSSTLHHGDTAKKSADQALQLEPKPSRQDLATGAVPTPKQTNKTGGVKKEPSGALTPEVVSASHGAISKFAFPFKGEEDAKSKSGSLFSSSFSSSFDSDNNAALRTAREQEKTNSIPEAQLPKIASLEAADVAKTPSASAGASASRHEMRSFKLSTGLAPTATDSVKASTSLSFTRDGKSVPTQAPASQKVGLLGASSGSEASSSMPGAQPTVAPTQSLFGASTAEGNKTLSRQDSIVVGGSDPSSSLLAASAERPLASTALPEAGPGVDYRAMLVDIYKKHAPDKLPNVDKYLQKYKGREQEMVAQLRKKYFSAVAPSPAASTLGAIASAPTSQTTKATFGQFGAANNAASTQSSGPFVVASAGTNANAPSGTVQPSSAVSMNPAKSDSGIGISLFSNANVSEPSSNDGDMRDDSQQQQQQATSLFASPGTSATTNQSGLFGSSAPSPFRAATTTAGAFAAPASPFSGITAPQPGGGTSSAFALQPQPSDVRSQVVAIYQRVDPSKLDKVDQFLAKYKGREADLLAQLHKKYGDKLQGLGGGAPFVFSAATAAFGEPARLGAGGPSFSSQAPQAGTSFASYSSLGAQFGAQSTLGTATSGFPATSQHSAFGSGFRAGGNQHTASFGAVAQSGSVFGSTAGADSSPFGSKPAASSTPFGQQQQQQQSPFGGQQPAFGAGAQQQPTSVFSTPQFQPHQQQSVFGVQQQQASPGFSAFGTVSQEKSPFQTGFGSSPSFTQMRG